MMSTLNKIIDQEGDIIVAPAEINMARSSKDSDCLKYPICPAVKPNIAITSATTYPNIANSVAIVNSCRLILG